MREDQCYQSIIVKISRGTFDLERLSINGSYICCTRECSLCSHVIKPLDLLQRMIKNQKVRMSLPVLFSLKAIYLLLFKKYNGFIVLIIV